MVTFFGIVLFVVSGAIFGSFACAQVWRIRASQLQEDKKAGEDVDAREYVRLKPLNNKKLTSDRSQCLSCGHELAWYDLIPLFSWLSIRGRCRYCKEHIGWLEPLMEFGYAIFFLVSYITFAPLLNTPGGILLLVCWLVGGVLMGILLVYDAKWFLLPEKINIAFGIVGAVYAAIALSRSDITLESIISLAGSLMIMSGLYLLIFVISRGAWIGFGDVILGIGLGFFLGTWEHAFLALFLANFLGLVAITPAYLQRKVSGKTHIPFGPFLITATVIVVLHGDQLMIYISTIIEQIATLLLYPLMV